MSASKGERVVISAKYPQTPPCKTNTHDTIENIQIYNRNIIQQMNIWIYTHCVHNTSIQLYPSQSFTIFTRKKSLKFSTLYSIEKFRKTMKSFSISHDKNLVIDQRRSRLICFLGNGSMLFTTNISATNFVYSGTKWHGMES